MMMNFSNKKGHYRHNIDNTLCKSWDVNYSVIVVNSFRRFRILSLNVYFHIYKLVQDMEATFGFINPSYTENLKTGTLANSEDPDEMQHKAAFHQGPSCLLILKKQQPVTFRDRNTS